MCMLSVYNGSEHVRQLISIRVVSDVPERESENEEEEEEMTPSGVPLYIVSGFGFGCLR